MIIIVLDWSIAMRTWMQAWERACVCAFVCIVYLFVCVCVCARSCVCACVRVCWPMRVYAGSAKYCLGDLYTRTNLFASKHQAIYNNYHWAIFF